MASTLLLSGCSPEASALWPKYSRETFMPECALVYLYSQFVGLHAVSLLPLAETTASYIRLHITPCIGL